MNIIIESYTVLLECLLTFYFFQKIFPQNYSNFYKLIFVYTILFFLGIFVTLHFIVLVRFGIIVIFLFLSYYFYLKQPTIKVIYAIILFFSSMMFADLIAGALLSLFKITSQDMLGNGTGRFLYNTASKLIHLVFLVLISTATKLRYDSRSLIYAIPLISCNILSFITLYFQFVSFLESRNFLPFIVTTVALLIINIVLCIYTECVKYFYELKERHRLMVDRIKNQEQYYQDMIARQDETRSLWHDIKKYIMAIENLVIKNDQTMAEEALAALKEKFDTISNVVNTGNSAIDGIINYGMQKALAAHIPMDLDLWVDPAIKFPAVDCYIILGNTIDNAIEACSVIPKSESPSIKCTLHQKNHILFYEITNPIPQNYHRKNDRTHGYGLKNVKACVQRNEGSFTIKTNDHVFCVQIFLNV